MWTGDRLELGSCRKASCSTHVRSASDSETPLVPNEEFGRTYEPKPESLWKMNSGWPERRFEIEWSRKA